MTYFADDTVTLHLGDAATVLATLPDGSVDCVVTSPPYFGLRDYGVAGQIGAESSPAEFVAALVAVFDQLRRVLADDGTAWLNLGSSYMSSSPTGTQGKTGQRADRTFTASGVGASSAPRGARTHDTTCTEQSDCRGSDCACSGLCDGCADVPSSRNADNIPHRLASEQRRTQTIRGISPRDYASTSPADEPPDVQESTIPQSSEQLRATCSHCRNCGVCLAVLGSSSRDARLCARMGQHIGGTSQRVSADRNQGRDALGTAWLNYSEMLGPKSLIPIPWMLAMSLQTRGWVLRNSVIWAKPNAMPESVTDRLSNRYEHLFLFSKSRRYWFDLDPIREAFTVDQLETWGPVGGTSKRRPRDSGTLYGKRPPRQGDNPQAIEFGGPHDDRHPQGRNPGDVWSIPTAPFPGAHFAAFPPELPRRCILAGCKPGGSVLDPFHGSGTTGMVAQKLGRRYVGIDLNAEYLDLSLRTRLTNAALPFEMDTA